MEATAYVEATNDTTMVALLPKLALLAPIKDTYHTNRYDTTTFLTLFLFVMLKQIAILPTKYSA